MTTTSTPASTHSSETQGPESTPGDKLTKAQHKDLVAYCNKCFQEARDNRLPFERKWYMNLSFFFGRQWVQWAGGRSNTLARLVEPKAPPWRVRMTVNRVRPILRGEMAKITKEHPTAFVIPASSDDDDISAAKAGEQIWEHQWRTLHLPRLIRRTSFWMVTCGNGFIKEWWDSHADDGTNKGAIAADALSPFHILVPEMATEELEYQPYIIHGMSKSPEWVKSVYKKGVDADTTSGGDVINEKMLSALGIDSGKKNQVSVKEMWVKPCRKFPTGAIITWAGDTILYIHDGPWPYRHGEYPFTKFDHVPAGRFYSDSIVDDLIPIQKEFNRTRSQLIEDKNRMARPQLVAQRGAVDVSKMTSEPGLVIQYTPGYAEPKPLQLTSIPNYVTQELDRCQSDMDDISGQHEVSKGQAPAGVTAATAISFLSEQDDTKLAFTIASIEDGVERIGKHFLSHVSQFWDAPRTVRVMGDNNTYETYQFNKDDLRGNNDLKVEAGSATPTSMAAKQAFITEIGKMGWIPPDKALKYLGMAETGRLYEEMMVDQRQAQRENLRMASGEELPVNTWDNDIAHMTEHDNFRKTQKFEYLPPEIKAIFEKHDMLHKQQMGQKQGTPVLPGELPPGAPGGPPPADPGAAPGEPPGGPPPGSGPPGGAPMPPPMQ